VGTKKENEVHSQGYMMKQGETFVKKWFNDTISLFETEIKSDDSVNHLCVTSLTVSVKYCEAILILLSRDCRMPAKALLRVLFELASKLAWCLRVPDEEMDAAGEIVEKKIRQWAKSSVVKNLKLLNGLKECITDDKASKLDNRIEKFETIKNSLDCDKMPTFLNVLKELPGTWGTELYTRCYLQFNNAVHLDVSSLGDRVKKDGEKLFVVYDSEDNIQDLVQYCVIFEKMVLYLVRTHYGWDTKKMQNDFEGLVW